MNWETYFIGLAEAVALKSKDSTRVGCVIVGPDNEIRSTGWNGFARGVKQLPEREERPAKYDWTCHSEANAVANAARSGIALKDCTAYVSHAPCLHCADMLIQSGIKKVVVGSGTTVGDHKTEIAEQKLKEAGLWHKSMTL